MIPAFLIKDSNIITFDSFSRSRDFRDIERAYLNTGITPCKNCYASQTLLIEDILRRYENNEFPINNSEILQESTLIHCHCIDPSSFLEVVNAALIIRRKRNVRRA